jgi:integrase
MEIYEPELRKEIEERYVEPKTLGRSRPWSTQRGRAGKPIPTINEIIRAIQDCAKLNLSQGAFLAILYATGCRICELIGSDKVDNTHKITYEGIHFNNIYSETDDDDCQWLCISTEVEKLKKRERRVTQLSYDIPWDKALIDIIDEYYSQYQHEFTKVTKLFPIPYRRAWRIVAKYFQVNPHYIRDIRVTHLMNNYHMSVREIQDYFKWKTEYMPLKYAKSSPDDIRKRLKRVRELFGRPDPVNEQ